MQNAERYKYFMWDEKSFTLLGEFALNENSDLADALNVFFAAGGYDFFNVVNPKYYSDKWLEFVGNLYEEIVNGKYAASDKKYKIPLSREQREELANRGVPEVFVRDL